jgi:prevent-host-death family protein
MRSEGGERGEAELEPSVGGPREVTMDELDRRAARVIRDAVAGEVAVVTRYGKPVAVIVPLADAEGLRPAEIAAGDLDPLRARFAERERRRWWSRILHGRWSNGGGIHGPYRRGRRA